MRFVTDLNKGILGKPDPKELWNDMISQVPDEVFLRKDLKILCIAFGHGTEADLIVKRMASLGKTPKEIKNSIVLLEKYQVFTKDASRKGYTNIVKVDFLDWNTNDKFDLIVSSPPHKDGSKKGGQNKIYNQFSKNALKMLKNDGHMLFITPTAVCKKSKRFTLVGLDGLKTVNFLAGNYFDARVCYWHVDKSYLGNVIVKHNSGVDEICKGEVIYDYSIIDKEFSILYNKLREVTNKPESRMFKHNAIDMSKGRSPTKTDAHIYPVYKLNSDGTQSFIQYNKTQPKLYKEQKLVIAITKTFNESMSIVDTKDYDMAHLSVKVSNDNEIQNIKSFIFSNYFKQHVQKWKDVDGHGYNYALMYLPKFDTSKKWNDQSVEKFLKSFLTST